MENLHNLYEAILTGKLELAVSTTKEAIEKGVKPQEIINGYMIKAMEEIGNRYETGKAFVPELLMAARAMKGSLDLLRPLLKADSISGTAKVAIGTVKGDLHDIGKNLVASMLEGCGFEVMNLGVNVSADQFINAVKNDGASVICMSALLTTTMNQMKEVIEACKTAGIREHVKIMVGGAPVNQSFADSIGADGYSDNANSAVALAKSLVGA
ncbi:corrinoid protein [Porphyromonadaceae bacterium]